MCKQTFGIKRPCVRHDWPGWRRPTRCRLHIAEVPYQVAKARRPRSIARLHPDVLLMGYKVTFAISDRVKDGHWTVWRRISGLLDGEHCRRCAP